MGLMPGDPGTIWTSHGQVEYYVLGKGPPLVLLHGLGGSAEVWYRVAPRLAEDFTVLAPQLWGDGLPNRPGAYTPEDGVSFLAEFLDAVECGPAHLCGSSLGGLIAGFTAVRQPDRVRTLIIAAGAGLGHEAALFLRMQTLPLLGEFLFRPRRSGIRRLVRMLVKDRSMIDEDLIETLYQDRLRPGVPSQMLSVLRSGIDLRGTKREVMLLPHLGQVQAPTLVLWGERDPLFPVAHARRAAQATPAATLHVFSDVGHWPYVERPSDFCRVLQTFLRTPTA